MERKIIQLFRPWKFFFTGSLLMMVLTIALLVVRGVRTGAPLNFGIDFTGGAVFEVVATGQVATGEVRELLAFLPKEPIIQTTIGAEETRIYVRTPPLTDEQRTRIQELFQEKGWEIAAFSEVGPTFSHDLAISAIVAVFVGSVFILLYIMIRFRFSFALGAILALVHDLLAVLLVFAIFNIEVNTPFIAALLTILGYSVNDTIVNFDRLRENLRLYPRAPLYDLINLSIVQMFSRSLNTSITTLLVVLAVILFGGPTLQSFMIALAVGFISGTYSSWYVANGMVMVLEGAPPEPAPAAPPPPKPAPAEKPAPASDAVPTKPNPPSSKSKKRKKKKKAKPRRR